MITAFMLVGMWVSFLFGGAAYSFTSKDDAPNPNDVTTVYKVGVDLQGNTVSTCAEGK